MYEFGVGTTRQDRHAAIHPPLKARHCPRCTASCTAPAAALPLLQCTTLDLLHTAATLLPHCCHTAATLPQRGVYVYTHVLRFVPNCHVWRCERSILSRMAAALVWHCTPRMMGVKAASTAGDASVRTRRRPCSTRASRSALVRGGGGGRDMAVSRPGKQSEFCKAT